MRLKVFTVYDSKTEAYLQPFCAITKASAIRAIIDSVNNPKSDFYKWPADYTLFEIGNYDDQKGSYEMNAAHINLGCLKEFVHEQPSDPRQIELISKPQSINGKALTT